MAAFPSPAAARPVSAPAAQPAHLNLDVQHAFGSVELSVSVDGNPALETTLAGSGRRFKVFGKRAARNFTRTLDIAPGAHIVRVRLRSAPDKFDEARVERFDLEPATVAALRIAADKSGLSLVADRPPAAKTTGAATSGKPAPALAATAAQAVPLPSPPATGGIVDLLGSLRSMLIAIAGFVASAATGFVVQEFLRSRRGLMFDASAALKTPSATSRLRPE